MEKIVPIRSGERCRFGYLEEQAFAHLSGLLGDDSRILPTMHAFQRMDDREVTFTQVLHVLRRGNKHGNAEICQEHNVWKFQFRADCAGQDVRVVVGLDQDRMGNLIAVISVIVH